MKSGIISAVFISSIAIAACAQSGPQTFTGVVTDAMCGKQHMAKDKTAAECTRECVKGGSDYALVVGGRVYTLAGDKAKIDQFAGEKATVTGDAKGETISVSSITAPKK